MDFCRDAIVKALPQLDEEALTKTASTLLELGVEAHADLIMVQERDLLSVLRPIQARKLLRAWDKDGASESNTSGITTDTETDDCFIASTSAGTFGSDWIIEFNIPWQKFPPDLIKACKEKKIPAHMHRVEMVRVLIDEINKVDKNPSRKNLERVALMVVTKYPDSFKCVVGGKVIATGIESLTDQLFNKQINNRRSVNLGFLSSKKTKKGIKSYGCVNWERAANPSIEKSKDGIGDKKWLKEHYVQSDHAMLTVQLKMATTYDMQRDDINKNANMEVIKENWPFLFMPSCLHEHYNELLGNNSAAANLEDNLMSKAAKVYTAVKCCGHSGMRHLIGKIKSECLETQSKAPKSLRVLDLLTCFFKEDLSCIYRVYKDDVPLNQILEELEPAPIIIVMGNSVTESTSYYVCVESVVAAKFDNFFSAIVYAFCCFYVFNLQYPNAGAATYEFIQRFFAEINNPGTKSAKRRKYNIHPKVMALLQMLAG